MTMLTLEDLRAELLQAPLVTESAMRSAFREELGRLVVLMQQTLHVESRKVLREVSERLPPPEAKRCPDAFDGVARRPFRERPSWSIQIEADPVPPEVPTIGSTFLPGELPSPSSQADVLRDISRSCTPVQRFVQEDELLGDDKPQPWDGSNSTSSMNLPANVAIPETRADVSSGRSSLNRALTSHKLRNRTSNRLTQEKPIISDRVTLRRWADAIVNHAIFDYIVAALILLNGAVVGIQTDYLSRELLDESPLFFQALEIIFCVLFTVELCLRLFAYRCMFFTMSGKGWNLFDLFVVSAQIFELTISAFSAGMAFSFNLLRVLRLIRIIRLARALRLIGELRTIVSSIAGSVKPLMWTGVLLFMVLYVLGVYTTQVVLSRRLTYRDDGETPPPALELYWGTLLKSIYSLFQSITGGVDWDQVARPLVEHVSPEMGFLFVLYIGFTMFCMLNVVTGVFIESVMKNAQLENELRTTNYVTQLFSKLDVNQSGQVTWEEFQKNLGRKEMQEFFKTIDVDIDNARTLFELLDINSSGAVEAREFMDGCLRIWAPTKGLDLRMVLRDVNRILAVIARDTNTSDVVQAEV